MVVAEIYSNTRYSKEIARYIYIGPFKISE